MKRQTKGAKGQKGRQDEMRSLVNSMGFSHSSLDIKGFDVLPILLEERNEEVDGHGDIDNQLIFRMSNVSNGHSDAKYFLQLKLHRAFHIRHFRFHILVGSEKGWEFASFVQTWSQDSRNLTKNRLACQKSIVFLGKFLDEFFVLVEFLEGLNVFEFDTDLGGLVIVDLVSKNAEIKSRLAFNRKLDGTAETFVFLWIVVFQSDLEFDGLHESFLVKFGLFKYIPHC